MRASAQTIGALVGFAVVLTPVMVRSQGTAFTYQGRLNSYGDMANGAFDFVFTAYDAALAGNLVAVPVTNADISVATGLFSTAIDFGSNVFTGGQRWLEIEVRTNGTGAFTTLSPRQPITAAPYAIYAGNVNASGISGAISLNNIGDSTITANKLAPGVAAANLASVGATVLSADPNATNLTAAGYVRLVVQSICLGSLSMAPGHRLLVDRTRLFGQGAR